MVESGDASDDLPGRGVEEDDRGLAPEGDREEPAVRREDRPVGLPSDGPAARDRPRREVEADDVVRLRPDGEERLPVGREGEAYRWVPVEYGPVPAAAAR